MDAPALHLTGTIVIDDHTEVSDLWVLGGRVSFSAPTAGEVTRVQGYFVPGLVDVHCHIGLDASGPTDRETARRQAAQDRDSGVLLIRDAGSPSDTAWIHDDPELPRLIRCGYHLARPKRYLRNYGQELPQADGLTHALVENLARKSDGWNKIVADWIDREVGDLTPLWSPEQLDQGFAAVHERGGRVTAHTFAHESIDPLLDAGIDCIEHGTGMDSRQMQRAQELGVPVTPTLLQIAQFEQIAAQGEHKFPHYAQRMRAMHARRYDHVHAMWEAGVQLLIGTDAGGTIEHGRIADECAELAAAGIPASDIVASASWRTREFLGVQGIAEGASADIVGYAQDPREDLTQLHNPQHVILRGQVM